MRITARTLLVSALVFAGPCAAASAQSYESGPSDRTQALILGPLMDEMGPALPQPPAAAFNLDIAAPSYVEHAGVRANASRFARAGLSAELPAGAELRALAPLAAFQGRRAVLAQSGASRLSVALAGPGQEGSLFAGVTPDYVEAGGMRLAGFEGELPRSMAVRYETSFDSPGPGSGLDIGIAPRAGLSIGDFGPGYEAGATFRVGQYVQEELEGRPAWWFFAGADREAVLYNPGQRLDFREAFALGDYAMIGDAQAGIAMRLYGADISLAYVQRETNYAIPTHSWETKEDFAAFSLSWRR
ncbi:DUF2219 family protein [Marinicauda algicola]|uniref:DUF2219 family protein n=1 Tax=Marinicauda algicola TaxID=2029849 RepID=A0A4S2GX13_9PROT|nr:DUF2219 family protein [Marinicauda algicola]TGY87573.1 DUF2219 family protein [Marinicauda algicola]